MRKIKNMNYKFSKNTQNINKTKRYKENGITLIALVITMIVLLILAGVTIATLTGENGIIKQAESAKENTEIATEKEAIALTISNKNASNEEKYDIGEKLYDRTIANGDKWNIVMLNESKNVYGNNWSYIGKGVNLENYGKTKSEWLVNYETGEIIKLEEEYTKLKYGENLAVREGLILNADPVNMENGTSWGEGVTLYGVQEGDGYGWNGTELKLDGRNDYIEIYTENTEIKDGITFEFYANAGDKISAMLAKTTKDPNNFTTNRFRTSFSVNGFSCCMSANNSECDWKVDTGANRHWVRRAVNGTFDTAEGGYLTMTADLVENKIALYWNGEYVDSATASNKWMISGGLTDSSIPFTIGLQVGGNVYTELYSAMNLYACRLYNKVLTAEEIKQNYDLTVAYHNLLVQENN